MFGPWTAGFALDRHTSSSVYVGDNAYGKPIFETERSPVGELLYKLKYRHDKSVIEPLADTVADFLLNRWRLSIDAIIPVPPSNFRAVQPVMVVADALAAGIGVPVCNDCLKKVKKTPQLKDMADYNSRKEALGGAFIVAPELTTGKKLLLFDDLHGSGATTAHIVEVLKDPGGANAVFLLTLTKKST